MDKFREDLNTVISEMTDVDAAIGEIVELVVNAIATPHISAEIDKAIVDNQLGERHGFTRVKIDGHGGGIGAGDKLILHPVDPCIDIFCRIYDIERRERIVAFDARIRAEDAVKVFLRMVRPDGK